MFTYIRLFIVLLLYSTGSASQALCSDLAVAEIRTEKTNSRQAGTDHFRVTVVAKNTGTTPFTPATGNDIRLYFSGKGYSNREMALQPVQALNPGQTCLLVFEYAVNKTTQTLPDWENIPAPREICARIIILRRNKSGDCDERNNRQCTRKI